VVPKAANMLRMVGQHSGVNFSDRCFAEVAPGGGDSGPEVVPKVFRLDPRQRHRATHRQLRRLRPEHLHSDRQSSMVL
jgi:hypothetical protein